MTQSALMDPVSQLPNRQGFFLELQQAGSHYAPDAPLFAVLVLNLHRFREINETFGFDTGDRLLRAIGERIRQAIRTSDFIARIGDDEYGILLPCLQSGDHALLAANKILQTLQQPMCIQEHRFRMRANIGIALFPDHGEQPQQVLSHAEQALVEARRAHVPYQLYERPTQRTETSLLIEHQLEQALQSGDLVVHLQPKVDLHTGLVCGAEALSRISHQTRGLIPPDSFVPVAEDSGLITPFSLWVLNAALRHCSESGMATQNQSVAVNLSTCILHDPDVVDLVERALNIWGVEPERLILEITETAMMLHPERSLDTLQGLRELGVQLSIDDFGTGYSSLAYLQRLPVNELKIDKSFVCNLTENPGDARIVRSIIDLAHTFDLQVVAEGVENQAILDQLTTMGCDMAQGYHIAKPMGVDDLERWLRNCLWQTNPCSQTAI